MILFLKFPLEDSLLGGAELQTLKLAKHFKSIGQDVKLITSDRRLFRLFEKHGLPRKRLWAGFEPTSQSALLKWPLTFFVAQSKFRKLIKDFSPGTTLFMQSLTEKLVLTPLILKSKILNPKSKIIWLEHKIPGRWLSLNPLKYRYLKLAKCPQLLTVSNFAKQEFIKLGVPEKNIEVIYPSIQSSQTSKFYFLDSKFFTIGLLSRLSPEKGVLDFLRTLIPELKKHPNWRILIAGEGEEKNNIQELIDNNDREKQIKLFGFINNLDEFFSRVSVLIYPTKVPESFGVSLLEAMTRGIPVIASKIGAFPEIIEHEKSGFLVPPNKPEAWIEYLNKLKKPEVYRTLSNEALVQSQKFSEGRSNTLYDQLLFQNL